MLVGLILMNQSGWGGSMSWLFKMSSRWKKKSLSDVENGEFRRVQAVVNEVEKEVVESASGGKRSEGHMV
jgi:hypothetical protein